MQDDSDLLEVFVENIGLVTVLGYTPDGMLECVDSNDNGHLIRFRGFEKRHC